MSRKLPLSLENDICSRHLVGESYSEITKNLGIGSSTIARVLTRNGIATPGRGKNRIELPVTEIIELYNSGFHANELGRMFGVNRIVIERRLDEAGIGKRTPAEANRIMMAGRTREENIRNALAANVATRGAKQPIERQHKMAMGRERLLNNVSNDEFALWELLWDRCISFTPQKAVGKYNVDVAINEFPIAVEVFGGMWHAHGHHAGRFRHRFDYLLDRGWIPVIIWADNSANRPWPIGVGAVEYLVSLIQRFRRNEPIPRQEQVIRGDGNACSIGKANLDYNASIGGDKCGDLVRGYDGRFTREASGM